MRCTLLLVLALLSGSALAASTPVQSIGAMDDYRTVKEDDTLIEIAYREDVGYVELRAANPELDPWLPGAGRKVLLPKQHILPDGPHSGIVVNLGEMRLFYYPKPGAVPQSYPLGIGREGLNTPKGTTTVVRKAVGPIWIPTDRMRKEHPELPASVGPGPDNPMGPMAMYMGWSQYAIHGTNRPWGIGRRVSSGCMRMYNQDITKLYQQVPVGTRVTVVDQPVKTAWIDGVFYIEAHPNAEQADQIENNDGKPDYEVSKAELNAVMQKVGDHAGEINWSKVRHALRYRPSYPIAVSGVIKDMVAMGTNAADPGAIKAPRPEKVDTASEDMPAVPSKKAEVREVKQPAPARAKTKEVKQEKASPDTKNVKTDFDGNA